MQRLFGGQRVYIKGRGVSSSFVGGAPKVGRYVRLSGCPGIRSIVTANRQSQKALLNLSVVRPSRAIRAGHVNKNDFCHYQAAHLSMVPILMPE